MKMITEDYVSFETAKLLKEKGFDENCDRSYVGDDAEELSWSQGFNNSYYKEFYKNISICSAPRISFVMKWLRKVHNITIGITFSSGIISYEIQKNGEFITSIGSSRTYEQMVEEAIKYCLENLI